MTRKKTLSIIATGRRLHTSVGPCSSEPLDVPGDEARGYIDAGIAVLWEEAVDHLDPHDDQVDEDEANGPDVTDTD